VAHRVRVWTELGAAGAGRSARRGDVVVIVDALRASTTIIAALRAGARRVLTVLTVEEAEAYLERPGFRVAGERGGARLPRFHYGNSPTELWDHRADIAGQILVLTTSNGTRCIQSALTGASALLVGSPVNASAVAQIACALAQEQRCDVTLVQAGLQGRPTDEDTFSARLIAGQMLERGAVAAQPIPRVRPEDSLDVFMHAEPAARLTALGYAQDIPFCARTDVWDTVPIYRSDGFGV
jgi:2-phosphosulfolactate phosphatase